MNAPHLRRGQKPDERFVGVIDIADPADIESANNRGWRIAWDHIYDGRSGSVAEPCAVNCFMPLSEAQGIEAEGGDANAAPVPQGLEPDSEADAPELSVGSIPASEGEK